MTYNKLKQMTMDEFIAVYNLPENIFNVIIKLESVVRLLTAENEQVGFKLILSCSDLSINDYEVYDIDKQKKVSAYNKAIRKLTS
jgi:hypothetical protein